MPLVPGNTLITATLEEGRELTIMLARKTIAAIQTDVDVRAGSRSSRRLSHEQRSSTPCVRDTDG